MLGTAIGDVLTRQWAQAGGMLFLFLLVCMTMYLAVIVDAWWAVSMTELAAKRDIAQLAYERFKEAKAGSFQVMADDDLPDRIN